MEGKKVKPRVLMVFGAPCSGKTTFAKKFADKFALAYYDLDEIQKKHNFTQEELLIILELIARTRQTVVIEGGLGTEANRHSIKRVFVKADYDSALVWIQTDIATIRSRMKVKYKSVAKAKNTYEEIVNELEAPTELERPIILSGKHTFETQTKHILAGLADVNKR